MKILARRGMLHGGRAERSEVAAALVLRARAKLDPGCPRHHPLWLPRGKHAQQTLQGRAPPLSRSHAVRECRRTAMDPIHERCGGLDVHLKSVVACRLTQGREGQGEEAVRTFGTMTADLEELAAWLAEGGCTHVAMESTGVYWKPVWNVLEGRFTLLLVNARHVKAVPGRKTDVRDCEWLADLLRHGLLRGSFVPDRAQRELRELTRYRTALVRERATGVNRLRKTLEGANVKLGDVATDILGVSGRQMLRALIEGTTDPAVLADLAKGKLRAKLPALERALVGTPGVHQHFLLARQLAHIDFLDET